MRVTIVCLLLSCLFACSSTSERENATRANQTLSRSFEYQAPKPENGVLMAAIEIGSLGLNYFIILIDANDNWELISAEFGRSNLIFNDKNAAQLIDEIFAFKKEIESKGVSSENIHLIASSSTLNLSSMSALKVGLSKEKLTLVPISSTMEANYALKAAVPSEFATESFLVDIGSGNTKFSWTNGTDTTTQESFGSKYYLDSTPDSLVFRKMRDIILEIPNKNRNLCFLIGGLPYKFAEFTDNKKGRYTILQSPSSYPRNGDSWTSGGVIYSAIYLDPTYSFIFDWDSNFAIGYLMTIN